MLDQVGLADEADRVVASLSLGTCRLVELARALVTSPSLLLADEPSSGLDAEESARLGEVLVRQREAGLAIVVVEHDLDVVTQVCDRAVVMDLGRVIADAPVAEALADPAVRSAYLGVGR